MEKIGLLFRQTSEKSIKNNLKSSGGAFVIKYSGLKSPDLSLLRQKLKDSTCRLFVVKNSIARRALKDAGLEQVIKALEGPCGLVFTGDDPVGASKVLYNFSREHENLKLEGAFIEKKVLTKKDIEDLARLPAKEVLRAKAVIILKAPISGIVGVLNQALRKFVYCLDQVKKKKEA